MRALLARGDTDDRSRCGEVLGLVSRTKQRDPDPFGRHRNLRGRAGCLIGVGQADLRDDRGQRCKRRECGRERRKSLATAAPSSRLQLLVMRERIHDCMGEQSVAGIQVMSGRGRHGRVRTGMGGARVCVPARYVGSG
jgi:hypothetical protein